jgi:thioredoxin-dependent peroxiredoxin
MSKIKNNELAIQFEIKDYLDNKISLYDYRGKKILVSFFRDASCPFCNIRLNQLIKNHKAFQENKIEIIAFFASSKKEILKYAGKQQAPFPIIPDPNLRIYKMYGVEESFKAKLSTMVNPKKVFNAMSSKFFNFKSFTAKNIVPADFLISENLTIIRAYYGKDFGDHISIEKVFNWND